MFRFLYTNEFAFYIKRVVQCYFRWAPRSWSGCGERWPMHALSCPDLFDLYLRLRIRPIAARVGLLPQCSRHDQRLYISQWTSTIVPILAQSSCFPNGKVVAEQEGCFFGGVSTNSGFSEALDTKKGMLVNYIYRLQVGKTNPIGSVMMSPAILKEIRLRGCSIADRSR